jgi:hypothetical protein
VQVVEIQRDGADSGARVEVIYHNIEKNGVVGAPEELVLTPGELNSKLYRTMGNQ